MQTYRFWTLLLLFFSNFYSNHFSKHILHHVLSPNGGKHYIPLPPLHYSTLAEYLRGTCLPFVTLTGDIVADSGINVLLQQIVLTGEKRFWIYLPITSFFVSGCQILFFFSFFSILWYMLEEKIYKIIFASLSSPFIILLNISKHKFNAGSHFSFFASFFLWIHVIGGVSPFRWTHTKKL